MRSEIQSGPAALPEMQVSEQASEPDRVTPMMAQYIEIKAANPDCLLFYRMGDFYELFFGDAEEASRTLGIMLTKRGKHAGADIPMCGVPIHNADDYLQRLIAAGYRVAVCEQLEDPAEAKKRGAKSVVRRDVVRLVTPGTITEENLLEPGRANILAAVARVRASEIEFDYGIAAVDISTGRFEVFTCTQAGLATELARLEPSEIIVPDSLMQRPELASLWSDLRKMLTPFGTSVIDSATAERDIKTHFGVQTLEAFGNFSRVELSAAAGVLAYIARTQLGVRPPLMPPRGLAGSPVLQIDAATRANLEMTRRLSGERTGSLLASIDETVSAAGSRLLAERLSGPLTDPVEINHRLDSVSFFETRPELRQELRTRLRQLPDMTRAITRLAMQRGGPRDLAGIRDGLRAAATMAEILQKNAEMQESASLGVELQQAAHALDGLDALLDGELRAALADDLPLKARDGGFVREGYSAELEELRALRDESRRVVAGLQADYAATASCRTLRIKHNHFLGYYVEVPQEAGERFLREPLNTLFIHRQTMAGAMRFSTTELSQLETRISSAGDQANRLEIAIFETLCTKVIERSASIRLAADALALLDVSTAFAQIASSRNWTRPDINAGFDFHIKGGRHPVVEAALKSSGQSFIANDCDLSPVEPDKSGRILLVTGPNMAGKSTFLRQNAVIAILAQMGGFVPAKAARIGVVDRLFSRVGAADDLARGRSTFMVEMVETAAILNQATERSLVILDEIGRGTATFDGLSIAWATIENLHDMNRSRSLFATHYHELTALSQRLGRLSNITMRVTEWQGDVVFLHEVIAGAADRSYGLQVAKLAGLPPVVIERARHILTELETSEREKPVQRLIDELPLFAHSARALPGEAPAKPGLTDALRVALSELQPDEMTPKEALEAIYRLRTMQ